MGRFLVTGGAGFVGSHVVEALVGRGDSVRVLDDLSTGSPENIRHLRERVELIQGGVEKPPDIERAVRDVDAVVHLAAISSVAKSVADPLRTDIVNIHGTLRVLLAARDAGVKRVVFASSSAVYGESEAQPKIETMIPSPVSPYALSKLAGEHYCAIFSRLYGLSTISLRFFNIFGPRQDPTSPYSGVIAIFIKKLLAGEPPMITGDGEQSRDFIYVADAVAAILAALSCESANGQAVNIGTGVSTTINELCAVLTRLTPAKTTPVHGAPRSGDVRHSLADITLARALLSYSPRVPLEQGLRLTFNSMRT